MEWIKDIFPNLYVYKDEFIKSCKDTLQMMVVSGIISFFIGLLFGVILTVTKKDGIKKNSLIYHLLDIIVNLFRSIPFLILLIFLLPVTRKLVGTGIGVKGAIVPLVFGTVPFFTRQVESALAGVSQGKIEAARSMGSGTVGIIFRVYLKESIPDIIRVTTITITSLLGLTTMAGAVGAGGIGSFAINYGQGLRYDDIVLACVILLVVFVTIIQTLGTILAKMSTNKSIITKRRRIKKQKIKA